MSKENVELGPRSYRRVRRLRSAKRSRTAAARARGPISPARGRHLVRRFGHGYAESEQLSRIPPWSGGTHGAMTRFGSFTRAATRPRIEAVALHPEAGRSDRSNEQSARVFGPAGR